MKALFIALTLSLSLAQAATDSQANTTTGQMTREADTSVLPSGFVPYLGVNAGYTDQQNSSIESEGMPTSIKAIGSYYMTESPFVLDAGLGMMNQQFSRSAAQDRAINTGVAELATRYLLENRWQAGVVANQYFEKGIQYGANQADAQFAGVQVLKEFALNKGIMARVGGRLMTDLNVDNKTVNTAMIDFQMGWNPKANRATGVRTTSTTVTPVEKNEVTATEVINETATTFAVNSSEIPAEREAQLKKLSAALAQNPGLVKEVQVLGHADSTGTEKINEPLSEKRAEVVAQILKENKLGQTKIQTRGFSDTQPISNDLNVNRRAEIKFIGVSDEAKLQEILKSIW